MALAPVTPLSQLSLQTLAGPLVSAVAAELSVSEDEDFWPDVSVVRGYLGAAPAAVLQELLHAVLARTDLAPEVRFCGLRLLLREDIAALSVGIFPQKYHGKLVRTIGDLGAGLHSLDMKGVWLRDDDLTEFCGVLARLGNLRVLGIPHTATDALLEAVGRHCAKLRAIDISGETSVSRRGLRALCAGPGAALQVVDVGNLAEMTVKPGDVAFLLRSLPNLISLGTYAYTGRALAALAEDGWPGRTRLEYLHDIGTTPQGMAVIRDLCPALASVYLDGADPGVILDLKDFPKLTEIKLHMFSTSELLEVLAAPGCGARVDTLELLFGRGTLDLTRVSALCPSLATLECYFVSCAHSGALAWPSLRRVGLFHSTVPTDTVLALTRGAPGLARLGVGSALDLVDADVWDVCGPELREVWLAGAHRLTHDAVLGFLAGCPRLTSLGELSGWSVRAHQVEELRVMCAQTNRDLTLWYYPSSSAEQGEDEDEDGEDELED